MPCINFQRFTPFSYSEYFVFNGKCDVTARDRDVSKPGLPFLWTVKKRNVEHFLGRSRFPLKTKESLH